MGVSHYCEKCNKTMDEKEFYRSNRVDKYPENGLMNQCKKCLTMHIDNWDPNTFLWILEDIDVPWIPDEWNKLMSSYARDPSKVTGTTILGRYLSKMRLKQHKEERWKDTEFIAKMKAHELEQSMKNQGYEHADIMKAVQKTQELIPEGGVAPPPPPPKTQTYEDEPDFFDQRNGIEITEEDLGVELTDDDKLMLRMKWGKTYKPEEWIYLESLYNEMMKSYDIQTAAHIDTLKLICKTSLKANQLIDINDVEGYQKMSKVYDALMKSGKFTAAQTKGESDDVVDSVGELVAICESQKFIPRYYTAKPQDKVDQVILDMQHYTHDLVTEELSLGNLIENALRKLQEEKDNVPQTEEDFEKQLFNYEDSSQFVQPEDYAEFYNLNEKLKKQDEVDAKAGYLS